MNPAIRIPAHAKVKLFLRVLAREDDGFHSLETLFCLLSLADELQAERSDTEGVAIEVEGGDCGPHGDNLAVRAGGVWLMASPSAGRQDRGGVRGTRHRTKATWESAGAERGAWRTAIASRIP